MATVVPLQEGHTNGVATSVRTLPHDSQPRTCLGRDLFDRIKSSRILVVGAGGIGCELLKNLVCTGFGQIQIVDLDTIDLSNLNRQFLFRHEHIKRSKALVAKETASKFNPNVQIEAHHANIKDPSFDIDWYKPFTMVFNALDNLEARRHVNKMCLAADVPLIESGTTGFNGQVQVIKKGLTECYDCNPKETPKTFPVCTIRSTPSQPIHCIVWAKSYLFAEVFGTSEDDSPELDATEDSENAKEIANLREEAQALKRIRESMGSDDFPRLIFEKVFTKDIDRLRSMEDMWKTRRMPDALNFDKLVQESADVDPAVAHDSQAVWTTAQNFAVFRASLQRLSTRLEEIRANADTGNAPAVLAFDKDDKDTLDFVAATANLRSIIFGIEPRSEFDIKQMAGNIIPAIATTNAMTAGLCVTQAFKVLRGDYNKAKMVFLVKSTDRVLSAEKLLPPKTSCPVCGVAQSRIEVDLERATLKDLVEGVLRSQLAYGEELSVSSEIGVIYDPDLEDNLDKKLSNLQITNGSPFTIVDDADEDPRVNLVLWTTAKSRPAEEPAIRLLETIQLARKIKQPEEPAITNGHTNGNTVGKRKREAEDGDMEARLIKKRGKVAEGDFAGKGEDDDLVIIDDDTNGAILIE